MDLPITSNNQAATLILGQTAFNAETGQTGYDRFREPTDCHYDATQDIFLVTAAVKAYRDSKSKDVSQFKLGQFAKPQTTAIQNFYDDLFEFVVFALFSRNLFIRPVAFGGNQDFGGVFTGVEFSF